MASKFLDFVNGKDPWPAMPHDQRENGPIMVFDDDGVNVSAGGSTQRNKEIWGLVDTIGADNLVAVFTTLLAS